MSVNRGKAFEDRIKSAVEAVPFTTIDRLHDQTTGYLGSVNVCDFIAYQFPRIFYLECKSVHGNTMPFSNITDNQWNGLLNKSLVPGVVAGYFIWFVDKDRTIFVSADDMRKYKELGNKSVNVTKLEEIPHIDILGEKKRVFFEYNMEEFFNEVGEVYNVSNTP